MGWAELMMELVDRLIVEVRKGKKTGSPLPVYISHLYLKYQVLDKAKQNDYSDAVKLLKYGGPETDSKEDTRAQSPSPSKEPWKRVRTEETPARPEVTATPRPKPEQSQN